MSEHGQHDQVTNLNFERRREVVNLLGDIQEESAELWGIFEGLGDRVRIRIRDVRALKKMRSDLQQMRIKYER